MLKAFIRLRHGVSIKPSRPFSYMAKVNPHVLVTQQQSYIGQHPRGCLCCLNSSRGLFAGPAIGIEKLDRLQEKKSQLFNGPGRERYIDRLKSYIQENKTTTFIKDDLVNLIGIAETDEDLDLLEQVAIYTSTGEQFPEGWGAIVMRLYYKLNKLDRAYKNMLDVERFGDFFDHHTSFKILMSMLYDAGKYSEVIDVYKLADERLNSKQTRTTQEDGDNLPKYDLVTITFAALAKIGDRDALRTAETLYHGLSNGPQRRPGLRPSSFLAHLAVCNDEPSLALNLIANVRASSYVSLRELKIISLIKLERFDDVLIQLREFTTSIRRDQTALLRSTLNIIEENINNISEPALQQELKDLLCELDKSGHISDLTLEELLFKPIVFQKPKSLQDRRSSFSRDDDMQRRSYDAPREQRNYNNNRYDRNRDQGGYSQQRHYSRESRFDEEQDGQGRKFKYQNMNLD